MEAPELLNFDELDKPGKELRARVVEWLKGPIPLYYSSSI